LFVPVDKVKNYKNRLIIFLFCSIFAAGISIKINDLIQLCSSPYIVREPSVITQSQFDQYFAKNTELHHHCKLSTAKLQDELVQLNRINRSVYTFENGKTEKINDHYNSYFSLIKSLNNSYSAVPILLQKESFLS